MQTTSKVLMVKPVRFGYNPQTAADNTFMREGFENDAQENALREFTSYVSLLRANKVEVVIAEDTNLPATPDSIFPNNWFTTHEDGTLVLYPMCAVNRRNERKKAVIDAIAKNFEIKRVIDLTWWETENLYLEGTGSMVLDRVNKIVYATESPRSSFRVIEDFCKQLGYTPVFFSAVNRAGVPIYHTNVLMTIGTDFAILCTEAVPDKEMLAKVIASLEQSGKTVVEITYDQLENFAGNMLELRTTDGKAVLVMSGAARKVLTPEQLKVLGRDRRILSPQLTTIELNGGGSARCMLAELF